MNKSCIVVTRFSQDQPGFLDFSYRIKALSKSYCLIVISLAPLTDPALLVEGVEYLVLAFDEGRKGWCQYLIACSRLIRLRRPDCVVLLHSLLTPMTWLIRDIPIALYWNEHPSRFTASPPSHPFFKRIARNLALRWLFFAAAKRASLVMPIGEAHRVDLLEQGCDPRRVKLIHMGVGRNFAQCSEKRVENSKQADHPLRLIYVGTISQARGRDIMLEAIRLVNRDKTLAHLTLVGASDEEIAYCRSYAMRLGISAAVEVRPRVAGAEIPMIMKNADVGLCLWEDLPWWRFNPPTKLFEYLVAGLPVLASDIRTHTQYISHGFNGLIFNYDSFSLGTAIRQLVKCKCELHGMRQSARESGRQYLWEKIEPVFLHAIKSLHIDAARACMLSHSHCDDPLDLSAGSSSDSH